MNATTAKKITSFIIMMMFFFSLMDAKSPGTHKSGSSKSFATEQTINPVIGDISFLIKFGYFPNSSTEENLRIRTHFEYVENLLRQRDVSHLSPEAQLKRHNMIDLFHEYAEAGNYPRNYDFVAQRKPCFVDRDNTICAVGYLVENTAGREAAEEINGRHKYENVLSMDDDLVINWIEDSGLTKEEVAMIQPTYGGGYPDCPGKKIWVCRYSECISECKCLNPAQASQWQSNIPPCGGDGGGNGNGNGNGNNGGDGPSTFNAFGSYVKLIFNMALTVL